MKLKIIFSFLVILIISLVLTGCSTTGNYDEFAQCLTEKGVTMYGTEWCSHCQDQKEMFGSSFQYIYFVDCDKDRDKCTEAGVTGYPTWRINGENYPGEQSLYKLASLTNCSLGDIE